MPGFQRLQVPPRHQDSPMNQTSTGVLILSYHATTR